MGDATAMAREAMIAYLRSGELKPPRPVASAPGPEAARAGFLTTNIEEGSLFLKCTAGDHYRLEWPKQPPAPAADSAPQAVPNRRRALPPGDYTLTGYRVVRRDARAVEWFIS